MHGEWLVISGENVLDEYDFFVPVVGWFAWSPLRGVWALHWPQQVGCPPAAEGHVIMEKKDAQKSINFKIIYAQGNKRDKQYVFSSF